MPSRASGYGGYGQRPAYGAGRVGGGLRAAPQMTSNPRETGRDRARPLQTASPSLQLAKGDMVDHKAFGRGMVLSVQTRGGVALVEIAFDNVGTNRLMLKSAAAHMTKA